MVFSSLIFLFQFLTICLLLYFIIPSIKLKNILLLVASLFFYAWGEPVWVTLLIFSALLDYTVSNLMFKKGSPKAWLIISVVLNLSLLITFKFSGFIIQNINALTSSHIPDPGFMLPIGISFYTFQTMSYTIDVYRKKVPPERSFIDFITYVSLFPQLIAGPIVRYSDISKELKSRKPDILNGVRRFIIGLGKKVLLANTAGALVGEYLGRINSMSVLSSWVGVFFFSLQIYFDFSGYSDMAIGLGKLFGFQFLENFEYPYISKSITEFWRRWHISLSSFFRDYLYIPLGGNRKLQVRNMLIVWALTGLWHGASWNFVLWGLYYFVFLVIEKYIFQRSPVKAPAAVRHVYTLFVVMVGWAVFYFTSISELRTALSVMFGFSGNPGYYASDLPMLTSHVVFIVAAIIACMPFSKLCGRIFDHFIEKSSMLTVLATAAQTVFLCAILFWSTSALVGSTFNPFLYFRF
ncbi:MAG: MBOAT family protein [Oscillospiraceae bacterium]|nr:MBOAT family protein [Oscillospiraceae bacterium]